MTEIHHRFKFHDPNQDSARLHDVYREAYTSLANFLEHLPESRERELALTKLEESGFWANAAIARHISAKA